MKKARWSMGLFVWYFGTKGTAEMWKDVGHHTIINGPRYRGLLKDIFQKRHLADDMSIYLHRPSVTDPSVAPDGDDTFYALSPVPNLVGNTPVDWGKEIGPYRQKLAHVLEEQAIPGFEKYLSSEIFTPETFRPDTLALMALGFTRAADFSICLVSPITSAKISKAFTLSVPAPSESRYSVVTSSEVLNQLVPDAADWVKNYD